MLLLRSLARPRVSKLPSELLQIYAMLSSFFLADENHRNVPTVALLQDWIGIYIDFPKRSAEFFQERRDGSFGFVAEVASRARVESNVAGA